MRICPNVQQMANCWTSFQALQAQFIVCSILMHTCTIKHVIRHVPENLRLGCLSLHLISQVNYAKLHRNSNRNKNATHYKVLIQFWRLFILPIKVLKSSKAFAEALKVKGLLPCLSHTNKYYL